MKIQQFFSSVLYFVSLSVFTFIIWANQLDMIGVMVLSSLAFFVLIFKRNSIHSIPIFFNMLFVVSRTDWAIETLPLYLYMIPILAVLGFIIHYLRFHDKWIHGHLMLPIMLLFIGMILTVINNGIIDRFYLIYIAFGLFYLLFYLFFLQTLKGDQLEYLIKLFFVLGILVSAEVLYHYLSGGDIAEALRDDRVHLGWGLSNYVATYLIIFIPAAFYFIKTKPLKFVSAIVVAFEIMMLLFTLSRGGVLAFTILSPFLIIYIYHGQKSKFRVTMYLLLIAICLVSVFVFRTEFFQPLFERFKELDFTDGSGRVDIWIHAYNVFREHPLLGAGLLARFEDGSFHFFHNTVLHTLASFGLIGLASLIWQLAEVLIMFIKKSNVQKVALFLALLGANIHGMVDNVYYQLQFMAIFFVIIAAVESFNRLKPKKSRFWRLEDASTYEI